MKSDEENGSEQETSEDLEEILEGTPLKIDKRKIKKLLSPRETHFAKLMADGLGSAQAARIAFLARCEPDSVETKKYENLARAPRVVEYIKTLKQRKVDQEAAKIDLHLDFGEMHKGKLREYAFRVLQKQRDAESTPAHVKFNAIKMLKSLHDPGKDVNLIWKWIDIAWRYQTVHCPACHDSFPLAKVQNEGLGKWRDHNEIKGEGETITRFDRQLQLIKLADRRRTPHPGQVKALSAPERHLVGLGGARAGKSYLLALFAVLFVCLPGVEIWLLGETYDRTSKEVSYIKRFLQAIFYPHFDSLIRITQDRKSGEMILTTKWGSELRVKSAKAKGSITGHALEAALCAEPGWLPADIYEELRARMSERLGRIIAAGTPKGIGGFVGRLTNMSGRDPVTGKIVRWKAEDRLIANGCDWNVSMLVMQLDPADNPEYVKGELKAARLELTDEEYASEFEGIGVAAEGAKFPLVKQHHLTRVEESFFARAHYVLGIDQGPTNFAAVLVAYDGDKIVACWEYFNSDKETTMQRNLERLRSRVPRWINMLGGNPDKWRLTITDRAPELVTIFHDMSERGQNWPTDIVERHNNNIKLGENWRRENQEFINNFARADKIIFHSLDTDFTEKDESPGAYQLHDQVMQVIDTLEDRERESKTDSLKGWQVSDPWRGDHVLDAWYLAIWTVHSQQLLIPATTPTIDVSDPWAAHKEAFNKRLKDEDDRLLGRNRPVRQITPQEQFQRLTSPRRAFRAWYGDE